MKRTDRVLAALSLSAGLLIVHLPAEAQPTVQPVTLSRLSSKPAVWTLDDCIRYAMENNIQLQQSRNDILSGQEDLAEAKAARLPSVSASSSQGVSFIPSSGDAPAYSGSYNVGASMTLYSGGRLRNAIRQQEIHTASDSLSLQMQSDEIRIAII